MGWHLRLEFRLELVLMGWHLRLEFRLELVLMGWHLRLDIWKANSLVPCAEFQCIDALNSVPIDELLLL
jgi:hypothetical protein